jgi:hypothetical protein
MRFDDAPGLIPGLGAIAFGILLIVVYWVVGTLGSAPRNLRLLDSASTLHTSPFLLWKSYGYDVEIGIDPDIDSVFASCATAPQPPLRGAHCCPAPFLGEAHWTLLQRGQIQQTGKSGLVYWCDAHERSHKLWARAAHFVASAGLKYSLEMSFPNATRPVMQYHPDVKLTIASDWLAFIGLFTSAIALGAIGIGVVQTVTALRHAQDAG